MNHNRALLTWSLYNLEAKGDGNINAAFYNTKPSNDLSSGYLGQVMYCGNSINESVFQMKVPKKLAGKYKLWISNYEGATLKNMKGTVEIAVER